MKNIMIILVALSIIIVFPALSWAQEEEDPDKDGLPGGTDSSATTATPSDQGAAAQDDQGAMLLQQQASATVSVYQIDRCKLQRIDVGAKDQFKVETTCKDTTDQAYSNVIFDGNNDGYVDFVNNLTFKSINVEKQTDADKQFVFANQQFARAVGEIVTAFNTQLKTQAVDTGKTTEKCNQFITPEGVKYEVKAVVGREKNYPIPLAYKFIRTVNGDSVTIEISTDSIYKSAFAGILREIYRKGECPVSKWMEVREMGKQALPAGGTQALPAGGTQALPAE